MKLITEQSLREEIGGKELEHYAVEPGTIVTPSARQYLADRRIGLVVERPDPLPMPREKPLEPAKATESLPRFVGPDGGAFEVKPEHLTHLRGNLLVTKGHPCVALRGKFDSLQADILELQDTAADAGDGALVAELDDVMEFVRLILASEVRDEPLEDRNLLGFSLDELRAMSHNPKEFFGLGHLRPHYTMGKCCIGLNQLRTRVRELELAAFKAFEIPGGVERTDLIKALNRLSSTIYVLMYRHLPQGYDKCF